MQAGRSSCSRRGSVPGGPSIGRLCAVALAAATLAACSQTTGNNQSAALALSREALANHQAAPEVRQAALDIRPAQPPRAVSSIIHRRVAVANRFRPAAIHKKPAADTEDSARGVASYYNQGTQTANGEKFDPSELTAAHRTLPFGTRLRVTNVATGQSVTVRINDRGPFIPGRHVDLSQGAAETLGIVHRGIAKVKLDVLE
jgi:rare lipoprotein A